MIFTTLIIKSIKISKYKDLNERPETIKLLEENTGRTLFDINQRKILYDPLPRVMEIRNKINGTELNFKTFAHQRKLQTR